MDSEKIFYRGRIKKEQGYDFAYFASLIEQASLKLPKTALLKLWNYHHLIRAWNPSLNLSRIHNFENMVRKHYVDSLLLCKLLNQHNIDFPASIMDIGTGAGLPGIPLAIALPNSNFLLAESREARCRFLSIVVQQLSLRNVQIHQGSISHKRCPPVANVITRALERMSQTLYRVEKGLQKHGLFFCMKGPQCEEEINEVLEKPGPFRIFFDYPYCLPASQDRRRLIVWEKYTLPSVRTYRVNRMVKSVDMIESRANPRFKLYYSLRKSAQVKKHSLSLIFGLRFIEEFLKSFSADARALLYPAGFMDQKMQERFWASVPPVFFAKELFRELDFIGSGPPLLLINTRKLKAWDAERCSASSLREQSKKSSLRLFLPFGNPENLGAALRSCAAFTATNIVLLKEAAYPYHPKSIRSSAGTCFHLDMYTGASIKDLGCSHPASASSAQREMLALDVLEGKSHKAQSLESLAPALPPHLSLVLGEEGGGIPESLQCRRSGIALPSAKVESLNANTALGIALYILSCKWPYYKDLDKKEGAAKSKASAYTN